MGADLAQNKMQLYLIPSRQLNLSRANEYACYRGESVKWHTNYTYIILSSVLSRNSYFEHSLNKINDEKYSFCRLVQHGLNIAYDTSIFWSMFMLLEYW